MLPKRCVLRLKFFARPSEIGDETTEGRFRFDGFAYAPNHDHARALRGGGDGARGVHVFDPATGTEVASGEFGESGGGEVEVTLSPRRALVAHVTE